MTEIINRNNSEKTSIYGGCDFQTECWDYKGSLFQQEYQNLQIINKCQSEGGQFVSNGCTNKDILASCLINKASDDETILHFYLSSGLNLIDVQQLCAAQGGETQ